MPGLWRSSRTLPSVGQLESSLEDRDRRLAENEFEFQVAEAAIAISSRHLAVRELQVQAIVDNVPGAIYRCLPDDGWDATFISDAIEDITGYPASDFLETGTRSLEDIVHPDDLAEANASVRDAIERGQAFELDYRVSRSDGQERQVREQGQPVYDEGGKLL